MIEREEELEAWLHTEMGYSYVGPNSFYRLTMREIRRLQRGYAALNRTEGKTATPRESDWRKLEKFKAKLGLN